MAATSGSRSATPLRFVLLEDDSNDVELIQLQLAGSEAPIEWRHVMSERDFKEALAGPPPNATRS